MSTLISVSIETNPNRVTGIDSLRIDATKKEFSERNFGKLIESKWDHGCVRFSYEVEDAIVAKAKAILVVAKRFPGHSFTVDVISSKVGKEATANHNVKAEIVSRYEFKHNQGLSM